MKLFFDQNLSFKLCKQMDDLFPGSEQAVFAKLDRASDRNIWKYAGINGFILVSQDADFAEFAAFYGPPPKLIWLRFGNQSTAVVERKLRTNAARIFEFGDAENERCLELY